MNPTPTNKEIEEILRDLFTESVKRYSTITGGGKPIENIHFTADNFDKFWSDVSQALQKIKESSRRETKECPNKKCGFCNPNQPILC